MLNGKILFWPGMGKPENVLRCFLDEIALNYEVCIFPFEYDSGDMPFSRGSHWCRWLEQNQFSWWCGLSLGASLAFVMSSLCPPERLTMINPFCSRRILAHEIGFTLANQWDFSPSEYVAEVRESEAVISVHDEKIPIWHGVNLLNHIRAESKRLIFVDSNHCIDDVAAQSELAGILTGRTKEYADYCNVYQRQ